MSKIFQDIKLDFKDVLILPQKTTLKSRSEVELNCSYKFLHSKKEWSGIPIMTANMDTIGTFEMYKSLSKHNIMTTIHKHYSIDDWLNFSKNDIDYNLLILSTGISSEDLQKTQKICQVIPNLNFICIDVANGYSETFLECIRKCREEFKNKTIIAGNVVTPNMVKDVIEAGADIVKIGIGPGSVCTTRKKTGIGYPQLSAILDCEEMAHSLGAHIISDGGCTVPGDLAKAFGAGSDFVMLGGMLSGHDECGGKTININGNLFKEFYGMSSSTAMSKYSGGVADYRASEGKHVRVPYRGSVHDTVIDILGGLRSSCTYTNSKKLELLRKNTQFIRVSQQTNEIFSLFKQV
jgi:GMP reductase